MTEITVLPFIRKFGFSGVSQYAASTVGKQLLATRKERSGLLKAPVFNFLLFIFFILDLFVISFTFGYGR